MIRSMTGFGAADGEVGGGRVSVEVRSVNHRFFSPSIKLPGALARWEGEVREALKRAVTRGHVTLSARFERTPAGLQHAAHVYEGERKYVAAGLSQIARKHRTVVESPLIRPIVAEFASVVASIDRMYGQHVVGF